MIVSNFKKIIIIILIFIILFSLTGCYDFTEVDELTYITAIGVDRIDDITAKITFKMIVPRSISQESSNSSNLNKSSLIITVEEQSILSAINMANTSISKRMNLSHAKILVFSKDIAQKGNISKYINGLDRSKEFRPDAYVLISDNAEKFLTISNPILEINPSKYYELLMNSYKDTGFTTNSILFNFLYKSKSLEIQPVAILAEIGTLQKEFSQEDNNDSNEQSKKNNEEKPSDKPKEPFNGDLKAGNLPVESHAQGEIMGLAVFKGTKMVGKLNGYETRSYLMTTGQFEKSNISIPDPLKPNHIVGLRVKQPHKPKIKINLENGRPHINIKIMLTADIQSIQSEIDYEDENKLSILQDTAKIFFKTNILNYLNKTSKEFESDITGFGKYAKNKFITWKDWEDFKWLDKYKDASFSVDIDMKIKRTGFIRRTILTR